MEHRSDVDTLLSRGVQINLTDFTPDYTATGTIDQRFTPDRWDPRDVCGDCWDFRGNHHDQGPQAPGHGPCRVVGCACTGGTAWWRLELLAAAQ